MTTPADLVGFLRAQLDEDERVAREAGSRSLTWPVGGTWYLEGVEHNVVGDEEAFCHPHNVEHIARQDPARVLADVDAKRRILDEHEPGSDPCDAHDASLRTIECDTIRLLALPYADHPDYREEWRP